MQSMQKKERTEMRFPGVRALTCVAVAAAMLACSESNPFDDTQVPRIAVSPVLAIPVVTFSWTPAGAQQIRVFKGTTTSDDPALLWWSITGTSKNSLVSSIEYGVLNPVGGRLDLRGKLLVPGQPYTVEVSRADPNSDDAGGITGTGARYRNTQTFTVPSSIVPP
jgi:hypothetical protein